MKYVTDMKLPSGQRWGRTVEAADWEAAQALCSPGEEVIGTHVTDVAIEHFPGFWAELTSGKAPS